METAHKGDRKIRDLSRRRSSGKYGRAHKGDHKETRLEDDLSVRADRANCDPSELPENLRADPKRGKRQSKTATEFTREHSENYWKGVKT